MAKRLSDIEKYLYGYYRLKLEINELKALRKDALNELDYIVNSVTVSALSDTKASKTNRVSNPVLNSVIEIQDEINKKITRFSKKIADCETEQMMIMDNVKKADLLSHEYQYIRLRYFEHRQAKHIGYVIAYSERQCRNIKNAALGKIARACGSVN